MFVRRLELINFRCYRQLGLSLPNSATVLVGGNAQGKTSLLEALYLLATTRSPFTSNDRDLVNWSAADDPTPFASILAEVSRAREVVEQLGIDRIVALDAEHEERMRLDGVVAAIQVLDPDGEVARHRWELEQDGRIQAGVEKLKSAPRPRPTADSESTSTR